MSNTVLNISGSTDGLLRFWENDEGKSTIFIFIMHGGNIMCTNLLKTFYKLKNLAGLHRYLQLS